QASGRPARRDPLERPGGLLGPELHRFHDGRLVSREIPGPLSHFAHGMRLSLSKPYLAVALWLIQLLLASTLILPIGNALHVLLDRDPSADRMVAKPDYGWWET